MPNYEKLKKVIQEANFEKYQGRTHKIRLADVLLAIDKQTDNRNEFELSIKSTGLFMNHDECLEAKWNFKNDTLDAQSKETKQFLEELLLK